MRSMRELATLGENCQFVGQIGSSSFLCRELYLLSNQLGRYMFDRERDRRTFRDNGSAPGPGRMPMGPRAGPPIDCGMPRG